jgi:hypothetical protein
MHAPLPSHRARSSRTALQLHPAGRDYRAGVGRVLRYIYPQPHLRAGGHAGDNHLRRGDRPLAAGAWLHRSGDDGVITPGTRLSNDNRLPTTGSATGGNYATVGDLLRFERALRSDTLLRYATTQQFLTDRIDYGRPGYRYAYGFIIRMAGAEQITGHSASFDGIDAQFEMYLDSGVYRDRAGEPRGSGRADYAVDSAAHRPSIITSVLGWPPLEHRLGCGHPCRIGRAWYIAGGVGMATLNNTVTEGGGFTAS